MMPDVTREQWIKTLMVEALERTGPDRIAFLNSATADLSIRDEVLDLIEAYDQAGEFLLEESSGEREQFAQDIAASIEQIGSMIGRYKLIDLIGEGGFGLVYLAEQSEPVKRRVALKVIKLGMDTQHVVARFKAERQALAMMDHPNIAHVLDAGATEIGRPYFVMEFVEGVLITEFCKRNALDIAARLALFLDVCRAVHHAHQKGIIHRDIKPSNILVTVEGGVPMPKVIDFGVAKAMQEPLIGRSMATRQGQLLGTPEYMSPEQAESRGANIDTRSDIYSLGVVLYELLAGLPPFDARRLRAASLPELLRIIREENPPRPSSRLSKLNAQKDRADYRHAASRRLPTHIDSDLDWITLKAMEKDRDRRYGSAADLAEDINRHLRHEPVQARPASVTYRLGKLYRRHRVPFIAAIVVVLALIGGAIGTTAGMLRARESATRTSAVNDFMYDILTKVEPDAQGVDVRLADVLDDASRAASQRFAGLPEQEAEVRLMFGEIYYNIDLALHAASQYEKAAELLTTSRGPDDHQALHARVGQVRSLVNASKHRQAAKVLDGLLPHIQRALGPDHELALDAERLGIGVQLHSGRQAEAEQAMRALHQRASALPISDAARARILNSLILTLRARLGPDSADDQLLVDEIESLSTEMLERLTRYHGPDTLPVLRARLLLADVMNRQGDHVGAAEICESSLADAANRLSPCHSQRVFALHVLAQAKHRLGNSAEAAALRLEVIDCGRGVEPDIVFLGKLSDSLPYLDRGCRWIEGEAVAREFADLLVKFGGGHGSMQLNADLYIARFTSLQGRLDEADQLFAALMQRTDEAWGYQAATARMHLFYGCHLTQRGAFQQAETELNTAAETLDGFSRGTCRANPDDVLLGFIELYESWDKPEQTAQYQRLLDEMTP